MAEVGRRVSASFSWLHTVQLISHCVWKNKPMASGWLAGVRWLCKYTVSESWWPFASGETKEWGPEFVDWKRVENSRHSRLSCLYAFSSPSLAFTPAPPPPPLSFSLIPFLGVFETGERISMPPSFLRVMEPPLGCETSCPHATRAGFSNHLPLQWRASMRKFLPLPLAWMPTEGTARPFSTPFDSFFLNTVPCLPLDLERAVNILKTGYFSPNILSSFGLWPLCIWVFPQI